MHALAVICTAIASLAISAALPQPIHKPRMVDDPLRTRLVPASADSWSHSNPYNFHSSPSSDAASVNNRPVSLWDTQLDTHGKLANPPSNNAAAQNAPNIPPVGNPYVNTAPNPPKTPSPANTYGNTAQPASPFANSGGPEAPYGSNVDPANPYSQASNAVHSPFGSNAQPAPNAPAAAAAQHGSTAHVHPVVTHSAQWCQIYCSLEPNLQECLQNCHTA